MRWNLDTTHAEVEFAVKHLMISTVKGRFKTFSGFGETAADGTLTAVEMSIDTASIDTNAQQRDDQSQGLGPGLEHGSRGRRRVVVHGSR